MKKVLSLVLIVCMLLSSLVLLPSCGKAISVKDIEENPAEALAKVQPASDMLEDKLGIADIISGAANGGSVAIVFESNSLMGDITSIGETIYMNGKDKQFVSDTAVKYDGQDLAARIFIDKSGLILNSEAVLGSNKSLELNLATLEEKFTESALAQMLGMPAEEAEETKQYLGLIRNIYEKYFTMFDDMQARSLEMTNRIFESLEQTVSKETVNINGKDVKCIVVSYTITNQTVEAYMDICVESYMDIMNDMLKDFEDVADLDLDYMLYEMQSEMEDAIEEMNAAIDIALKLNINIDPKSATIKSETVKGTIVGKDVEEGEADTANVDCEIVFDDDSITGDVSLVCGEESFDFDMDITRTVKGGTATYSAIANYKLVEDGVTTEEKVADITYTYTHSSGEFKLEGTVGPEDESAYLALEGSMKVEDDTFALKVTSATMDDVTVRFDLSVTYNKVAEIPARPTDAMDVVDMTEGNLVDFMTEIQGSPLGKIITDIYAGGYEEEFPDSGYEY